MAIHPFTYPLHLPASTGSSQPRPPSCPSELGAVARSSRGSVGMAIPVQVVFDCADPPVIAVLGDALGYQLQGSPEPTAAWRAWLIEHGVLQEHWDDASAIIDPDGSGPRIYFQRVPEPRRHRHHRDQRHRAHPARRHQREQAPPPPHDIHRSPAAGAQAADHRHHHQPAPARLERPRTRRLLDVNPATCSPSSANEPCPASSPAPATAPIGSTRHQPAHPRQPDPTLNYAALYWESPAEISALGYAEVRSCPR